MGTVNSTVAAKQVAFASKLAPASLGGRVRIATGYYDPAGTEAAGTVLNLCKLPAGARILPNSQMTFETGQDATLTVKVGDTGDDDRYYAAAAPGATLATITLAANALGDYVLDSEQYIKVTTGVAALAAKRIAFAIFYVVD